MNCCASAQVAPVPAVQCSISGKVFRGKTASCLLLWHPFCRLDGMHCNRLHLHAKALPAAESPALSNASRLKPRSRGSRFRQVRQLLMNHIRSNRMSIGVKQSGISKRLERCQQLAWYTDIGTADCLWQDARACYLACLQQILMVACGAGRLCK